MLGPTMTPVLIVPLVFASSGNAGWLAYVFGTIMLLFVALNLREFARRSATAGSLYTYAQRAFGARGSMLAGVCLLWAYAFVCAAGLTGFAVFGRALLGPLVSSARHSSPRCAWASAGTCRTSTSASRRSRCSPSRWPWSGSSSCSPPSSRSRTPAPSCILCS